MTVQHILSLGLFVLAGPASAHDHEMCMEMAAGVTAAMLDCIGTTFERADGALNALWDEQLPQADAELADLLRKAQRDWIDYRDTTCAAEGAVWGGGSFAAVALSDCRLRLTQERLGWLEKISRPER